MEPVRVRVCVGTNCCFAGGEALIEYLENDPDIHGYVVVEAVKCLDKVCAGGTASPVVEIGGERHLNATLEGTLERLDHAIMKALFTSGTTGGNAGTAAGAAAGAAASGYIRRGEGGSRIPAADGPEPDYDLGLDPRLDPKLDPRLDPNRNPGLDMEGEEAPRA